MKSLNALMSTVFRSSQSNQDMSPEAVHGLAPPRPGFVPVNAPKTNQVNAPFAEASSDEETSVPRKGNSSFYSGKDLPIGNVILPRRPSPRAPIANMTSNWNTPSQHRLKGPNDTLDLKGTLQRNNSASTKETPSKRDVFEVPSSPEEGLSTRTNGSISGVPSLHLDTPSRKSPARVSKDFKSVMSSSRASAIATNPAPIRVKKNGAVNYGNDDDDDIMVPSSTRRKTGTQTTLVAAENDLKNEDYCSKNGEAGSGDSESEYEIETIRTHKVNKGKLELFVKWKGYPDTDSTWEPEKNLIGTADEILRVYWSSIGGRPSPTRPNNVPKLKKKSATQASSKGTAKRIPAVSSRLASRTASLVTPEALDSIQPQTIHAKPHDRQTLHSVPTPEDSPERSTNTLPESKAGTARNFEFRQRNGTGSNSQLNKLDPFDDTQERNLEFPEETDPENDGWEPPEVAAGSWEDLVVRVDHLQLQGDDDCMAAIIWVAEDYHGNRYKRRYPYADARLACPNKLLEYYERNVSFDGKKGIPAKARRPPTSRTQTDNDETSNTDVSLSRKKRSHRGRNGKQPYGSDSDEELLRRPRKSAKTTGFMRMV